MKFFVKCDSVENNEVCSQNDLFLVIIEGGIDEGKLKEQNSDLPCWENLILRRKWLFWKISLNRKLWKGDLWVFWESTCWKIPKKYWKGTFGNNEKFFEEKSYKDEKIKSGTV